ncbi:MAG TPA: Nramp family divalent metal transporter [Candidatus Angelobacter sp.]|nr:Nramp family divalent metal transporter [Candidatus Angelobacter sp.]
MAFTADLEEVDFRPSGHYGHDCSTRLFRLHFFVTALAPARWMRLWLKSFGPGIITGAADDDPSGIATYSVAGAQLGTKLLWTALLTWPLMAAVQMMCARIGMVTGQGLAGNLKRRFPGWLLWVFVVALLAANTINIGSDLAGMADAAQMLSGVNSHFLVVAFAGLISWATIRLRYHQIANVLKWLVLVLFAYPITAFVVGADWGRVARDTFIPSLPHTREEWSMLVAILGTTISPYLFFWQASEEVEEEKAAGLNTLAERRGATAQELQLRRIDVGVGTFFSNVVMFFIILTTAITLNRHGLTHIETSRQAAEALRPLAGKFAATLFTVGIVGVGFLAIPTLAGSAAYAFAETLGWRQGLDKKLKQARSFYALILLSTGVGVGLNFAGINPVRALYWTAVINGLLAPFVLVAVLVIAADKKLMQGQPSSRLGWIVVAITTVAMFAAGVSMFVG